MMGLDQPDGGVNVFFNNTSSTSEHLAKLLANVSGTDRVRSQCWSTKINQELISVPLVIVFGYSNLTAAFFSSLHNHLHVLSVRANSF